MVEPHSSNFRVITTNFLGVRIFRKFTITVAEWCRTLNQSGGIFNLHQRTIMDSFSCILFIRQLQFRLDMLFYQYYAKITTFFDQEKFGTAPLLFIDVETFGGNWRENDIKTSKSSYWRHIRELSYTPLVRKHFLAPVGFTEIPVGYARKYCHCLPFSLYDLLLNHTNHDMTKPTKWVCAKRRLRSA